jgi:NTE family protein
MPFKVVVMFGGGGALGAFGCGVWRALAARLPAHARIVGAAGVSIGAVNAMFVARHGADIGAGAQAMESTWRRDIATPAFPFLGAPFHRMVQSWNGFLTGILIGTRGMARPHPAHWNPWMGLDRLRHPLMDRSRMWALLESRLGSMATTSPHEPMLAAAAVDVMSGKLRLFDSTQETLDVRHLCASSAIPMMYEPVQLDGRTYWDGDITHEAALPLFLDALRREQRLSAQAPQDEVTLLVTIDQMSETLSRVPSSGVEMAYRAMDLLIHGKMDLPSAQLTGFSHVLPIRRQPLDHDGISGQMDFSPERIEELIVQGMSQAEEAWSNADLDRWARTSAESVGHPIEQEAA